MVSVRISRETYDDLQGLRQEGETLAQALERMARVLQKSGVVSTGPGRGGDAWRGGRLDAPSNKA